MSRAAVTFVVLLPVTQEVEASEGEALQVAAQDPQGVGGAHTVLEAILLELLGAQLARAPHARLGLPSVLAVPGEHADLPSALKALLEASR